MKAYTTYLFDLDGTITDTISVWLDIFRDGLNHFNIIPPDDMTLSKYTHDWKQMVLLGLPEAQLPGFVDVAHELAKERLPKAPLHVGAYELLEKLKNDGRKLGIYSSMDRPLFELALKLHNLNTLTEVLIAGSDVSHRKPHPAGITKALEALAVPEKEYNQVVYIGDKDTDIQAAHNAGIDGVLYYPAAHQLFYSLDELKEHKPEYIITDWGELLA